MKCHQYWPVGEDYGSEEELIFEENNVKVMLLDETTYEHYIVRLLELENLEVGQVFNNQMELTAWGYVKNFDENEGFDKRWLIILMSMTSPGATALSPGQTGLGNIVISLWSVCPSISRYIFVHSITLMPQEIFSGNICNDICLAK